MVRSAPDPSRRYYSLVELGISEERGVEGRTELRAGDGRRGDVADHLLPAPQFPLTEDAFGHFVRQPAALAKPAEAGAFAPLDRQLLGIGVHVLLVLDGEVVLVGGQPEN